MKINIDEESIDEKWTQLMRKKKVEKAVSAGASSGEPGYATIPVEVDTRRIEDKGIEDISEEWEKIRKKILSEVEQLYGET